jgi:hypothetical protein
MFKKRLSSLRRAFLTEKQPHNPTLLDRKDSREEAEMLKSLEILSDSNLYKQRHSEAVKERKS